MILRMRILAAFVLMWCGWQQVAAQCAPAPDSPAFFRLLAEQRAQAKIAHDRAFYEGLLSEAFTAQQDGAKGVPKSGYISAEIVDHPAPREQRFYAIRNFRFVEHRPGFTVTSYTLTEGSTLDGETRAADTGYRETYQVEDGKWRLTLVETTSESSATSTQ
jgi:hypothetical protein